MMQVDPMAASMPLYSPYHYSYNNPVSGNDPAGDVPRYDYQRNLYYDDKDGDGVHDEDEEELTWGEVQNYIEANGGVTLKGNQLRGALAALNMIIPDDKSYYHDGAIFENDFGSWVREDGKWTDQSTDSQVGARSKFLLSMAQSSGNGPGDGWWDKVKAWFSEDGRDSPQYKAYMADRAANPEYWKKVDDTALTIGMSITLFTPGQSILNLFKFKGTTQAAEYTFTKTAAGHLASRSYMNSPLLIREIMATGPGVADASFAGGMNWVVQGTFNGSKGIYQLGINPETKVIYHFLFKTVP